MLLLYLIYHVYAYSNRGGNDWKKIKVFGLKAEGVAPLKIPYEELIVLRSKALLDLTKSLISVVSQNVVLLDT